MAVVCATEAPTAEGGLTASGSAAVLTAEKQAHEAMRRERSERKDEAQVASRKKIAALNRQATARGTVYMVHPGASGAQPADVELDLSATRRNSWTTQKWDPKSKTWT